MTINLLLWNRFDHGRITEALLGKKEFFISDHMYTDKHDFLLAINQLFLWSEKNYKEELGRKSFEEALEELINARNLEDAFRFILAYLIVEKDTRSSLSINKQKIANQLSQLVIDQASKIANNEQLICLIENVKEKLPEFNV